MTDTFVGRTGGCRQLGWAPSPRGQKQLVKPERRLPWRVRTGGHGASGLVNSTAWGFRPEETSQEVQELDREKHGKCPVRSSPAQKNYQPNGGAPRRSDKVNPKLLKLDPEHATGDAIKQQGNQRLLPPPSTLHPTDGQF